MPIKAIAITKPSGVSSLDLHISPLGIDTSAARKYKTTSRRHKASVINNPVIIDANIVIPRCLILILLFCL